MAETFNILRAVLDAEDGSGPAVKSFKNNVRSAKGDAERFSNFLKTAGKRSNRQYTVGLQQAGFQVGDFFTQVAGGQNPVRAFIQQGTQLAGAFGKWGAILGAAGSIVGVLALNLWDGEEATRSFEDAFDDWVSSLDNLEGAVDDAMRPLDELQEKYGQVDETIRGALQAQVEFAAFQARERFRGTMSSLRDGDVFDTLSETDPFKLNRGPQDAPGYLTPFEQLRADLDLTEQEFDRVVQVMRDLDATALTDSIADDKRALEEAADTLGDLVDLSDEGLHDGLRTLGKRLSDSLLEMRRMERMMDEARTGGILMDTPSVPSGPAPDPSMPGASAPGFRQEASLIPPRMRLSTQGSAGFAAPARGFLATDLDVETAERLKGTMEDIAARTARTVSRVDDWDDALDSVLQTAGEIIGTGLFGAGPAGGAFNDLLGVDSGGIIGAIFNAKGNVFSGGDVTPFARGGVVKGATAFPMPQGMGVMGEAGPEAIVPLSRSSDGKLGIKSQGGGVNVTMNITTPDVEGFRRSRAQIAGEMARAVGRAREF